ncbi:hypothetical protein EVAR_6033_1 [Eumeta japonica]|uniref:Uncharacterized protein n=1 Tax=Eumeta variegata TaxID=151549 RepID=A0A4C1T9U2_EUMVA|nr:hypothetical protein EVAR_6033_1 [Eumeta japonica]
MQCSSFTHSHATINRYIKRHSLRSAHENDDVTWLGETDVDLQQNTMPTVDFQDNYPLKCKCLCLTDPPYLYVFMTILRTSSMTKHENVRSARVRFHRHLPTPPTRMSLAGGGEMEIDLHKEPARRPETGYGE